MLDPNVLTDLEQLTLCSYCNQKYNDGEQCPKFLSCKHLFCLRCIESNLLKGRELLCVHCWKRTELQGELGPAEALPTYAPLLALVNNFSLLKLSSSSSSAAAAVTVGGAPNSILPGSGSSAAVAAANCKTTNHHDPCAPTTKERKSENCHTHGMPLALWCATCSSSLCRACATQEHSGHQVKSQIDAKEQLVSDVQLELAAMGKLSSEIQRLQMQQRDFLIKVLEACVTLKTHVETDLQNGWSHFPEISDARETLGKAKTSLRLSEGPADIYTLRAELVLEKERLQTKYQEMMLQCQLDDLIGNSGVVFNFDLLKQAVAGIHSGEPLVVPQLNPPPLATNGLGHPGAARLNHPHHQQHHHLAAASQNPILFLANYCMSQLYRRHVISKQQHHLQQNGSVEYHHPGQPIVQLPSVHVASVAASQPPPQQQQPQPPQQQQQQQQQPQVQQQVGAQVPQQPQPQPGQPQQQPQQGQQLLMVPPGSPSMIKQPGGAMLQASAANFMSVSDSGGVVSLAPQSRVVGPSASCPRYYFNIEVNNTPHGRIVIEVRPDMAPKMAKNFSVLATGEIGVGYKGCTIFQCWEGESVITGDFELNNGRGGRSIYEDGYFMPDDTKFPAVRGAVGMRRTQKRHDNLGMVGSQFRIILQDMRGFTGIFGHVVEGLELVEKISTYGDQTGKPTKTILITKCGKL